jgi:hemolysin III
MNANANELGALTGTVWVSRRTVQLLRETRGVSAFEAGAIAARCEVPAMERAPGPKPPVNPWPHSVAFVLAAIGLVYLIVRFHVSAPTLLVMTIYGCGLVILFGASSIYHALAGRRPVYLPVLRRIDHASIYVMIAGSYTPVVFFGLDGTWRVATICVVWLVCAAGVVVSIWLLHAPRVLSTALYAAFGWAAVIPATQLAERLSPYATALIAAGGVLYTAGAIVYATKSLNFLPGRFGFHEVFHCFVVAGAAVQFVAIAFFIAPPV